MVHGAVSCLTVATDILKPQKAWGEDFSIFLVAPTELAASKNFGRDETQYGSMLRQKNKNLSSFSVPIFAQKSLSSLGSPIYKYVYNIYNT